MEQGGHEAFAQEVARVLGEEARPFLHDVSFAET